MKVIVAGGRTVHSDYLIALGMARAAKEGIIPAEIVSGRASGADRAGERWAHGRGLPVKGFPADWDAHGKAAGPIRNRAMAAYADALVAFWDGESCGTANMVAEMRKLGKPVVVVRPEESP